MYDWTTNAILATQIKDTKDEIIIDSVQAHIKYITKRFFKPCFNIIDNVASKAIKSYLQKENINMQLVEPHNHQFYAEEREIHTFKNHFIAGMSIGDEKFPTILWSYLIRQAQDSLNILRTSRVHPKILAYKVLEVTSEFNRQPWALHATRETIFNHPEIRSSWGGRTLEA